MAEDNAEQEELSFIASRNAKWYIHFRRSLSFSLLFLSLFWETEIGGQREEIIPTRLCTVSVEPNVGLKPMNYEVMTWAEVKSDIQPVEPHRWLTQFAIFLKKQNKTKTKTK